VADVLCEPLTFHPKALFLCYRLCGYFIIQEIKSPVGTGLFDDIST